MPLGNITRGTTNPNRLRRIDRWLQTWPGLRTTEDPLVVDLGYGASSVTPWELLLRLQKVRPDVDVLGLEIDPERVATALAEIAYAPAEVRDHLSFARGGFEVPTAHKREPIIIRAFNVLRQYDESDVAEAWMHMLGRLQPGGLLVDGTCDELGRIATWVALYPSGMPPHLEEPGMLYAQPSGPESLTISLRLADLESPSIAATRLPKALIHHNVPGERIFDFFEDLDMYWDRQASLSSFGATQRWIATAESMRDRGWPIIGGKTRWRLGELTVMWSAIAPSKN